MSRVLDGPFFTGGGNIGRSFDVSPDGQRFLMLTPGAGDVHTDPTQILVVLNWFDELRRLTTGAAR